MRGRTVHLLGIGGIGMAALAGLLKARGFRVSGSEAAPPYSPAREVLTSLGLEPLIGFDPENLSRLRPEAVVVGNAIRADNPEARAAQKAGLPLYSLPSALEEWILPGKRSLVVAGTHGKTTTTALLSWVLEVLGADPAFLVGGILRDRGLNFRWGKGPFVVLEGDEYDSAFFDKTPKFWHYRPEAAILTSVEYDHADIYPEVEDLFTAFERFVSLIPPEGLLVFCADDPGARRVAEKSPARLIPYGRSPEALYRLKGLESSPQGTRMKTRTPEGEEEFLLPLFGEHNALNALAVLALLRELGFSLGAVSRAFSAFPGVSRRQEVLYRGRVLVVDDFAHHPTAVRVTLSALREALSPRRILLCFEPRTNTSKRRVFFHSYAESLSLADRVWIKQPPGLTRIPPEERMDLPALGWEISRRGVRAEVVEEIPAERVASEAAPGDLVVFMSSASFGSVYNRLIRRLQDRGL